MISHGESILDEEVCGVFTGLLNDAGAVITQFTPVKNVHENKSMYKPDPQEFINIMYQTTRLKKDASKDFVGIFHTHPNNRPYDSVFDREGVGHYGIYIIYSPKHKTLATYNVNENGWMPVNLEIIQDFRK